MKHYDHWKRGNDHQCKGKKALISDQKIVLRSREDCVEKIRIDACIVIELGGLRL